MIKLLVCGGRDYKDWDRLEDELNRFQRACGYFTIISGCARGVDTMAIEYAEKYNDPVLKFPADWDKYGRRAGHIRNQEMLDKGYPDCVMAFPGGTGTADMIRRAKKAGIPIIEIPETEII